MYIQTLFDNEPALDGVTIQTTNNSTTNVLTIPINFDNSCIINISVVAVGLTSGNGFYEKLEGMIQRIGAGNCTLTGTTIVVSQKTSGANSWSFSVIASGTNLVLQVNGSNTETVNWGFKGTITGFRLS